MERQVTRVRTEEKRLTALLAEKGEGPCCVGPAMLNALLTLGDRR